MRTIARLMLGAALALLVAAPAAASTLSVTASHGDITISTRQDAGVYRTTIYAPAEYWLNARARVAGPAHVRVETASGARTLVGHIRKATRHEFAGNNCASDKGYNHLAVWALQLGRVRIPVYVDASFQGMTALTWCAGFATHMHVTGVTFTLDPAFAAPAHGTYVWHALFDSGKTVAAAARVHQ
jgi:hypothetical protein